VVVGPPPPPPPSLLGLTISPSLVCVICTNIPICFFFFGLGLLCKLYAYHGQHFAPWEVWLTQEGMWFSVYDIDCVHQGACENNFYLFSSDF